MGITIPQNIGVSRDLSPTAHPEEVECILRVTERLPICMQCILEAVRSGASTEQVERQLQSLQMNLQDIADQIALVLPHKENDLSNH